MIYIDFIIIKQLNYIVGLIVFNKNVRPAAKEEAMS